MGDKSKIEWTDATWNPVTGCAKVSAGCKNCYAEREWPRLTRLVPSYAGREFSDVRTHADRLDQPLHWKKPRRVFVNSMSDLFHESVPFEFIDQVFAVMALAKQHTFQVLTKRADRMREYMVRLSKSAKLLDIAARTLGYTFEFEGKYLVSWPINNVWLGVSVEDQESANERIPLLLDTPAAVRWISAEPLLGPVDLAPAYLPCPNYQDAVMDPETGAHECCRACDHTGIGDEIGIDWVVAGGESGPKARPMHPQWARGLRDQCAASGVPFLFKQWGEWGPAEVTAGGDLGGDLRRGTVQHLHAPGNPEGFFRSGDAYVRRVGKKAAGRLLDGVQHDGYPKGVSA